MTQIRRRVAFASALEYCFTNAYLYFTHFRYIYCAMFSMMRISTTNYTTQADTYVKDIKFEPVHEISNNVVCATSKASDQPAHPCSLIRAFASRLNIQ